MARPAKTREPGDAADAAKVDAQRAALDAMGVSEEARALVLGGNFDRLFSLPSSGRSHYNRRPEVP